MLLPYSWPMRWNTRSAPVRSTRTATPGYFASKALAIFSASGRSTEVYQTTLPSFFAASMSCGVTVLAGGAADVTFVEKAAPATSALEPISTSRREIRDPVIELSSMRGFLSFRPSISSFCQCAAALRRQMQPDGTALRNVLGRTGEYAQLRAVLHLNHIITAAPEKDLPHYGRGHDVFALSLRRRNRDVMRADRYGRRCTCLDCLAAAAQRCSRKVDTRRIETLTFDNVARADEACDE